MQRFASHSRQRARYSKKENVVSLAGSHWIFLAQRGTSGVNSAFPFPFSLTFALFPVRPVVFRCSQSIYFCFGRNCHVAIGIKVHQPRALHFSLGSVGSP